MRSHVIKAVFWRNLASYFSGVIGYLFIVVFVVACAAAAFSARFFTNNLATLDQLSEYFPLLLLFIVPAVTMTSWAEEKRQGTDELLFTLPANDFDVLLGKYLAVLAVYTIALAFSGFNLFVLEWYAEPDWGLLFTTYFGYWLAGGALLAAGMFASVLTNSVTVAFVLGVTIGAIPIFVSKLSVAHPIFGALSLPEQMKEYSLGLVPLTSVVYFVSLTSFLLYLNLVFISKRHWSGGREGPTMWVQYVVRAVSLAVALISVNVLVVKVSEAFPLNFDLTTEKLFTLSPSTRELIAKISSDRPVTIQAFISPEVPREQVSIQKRLKGLLRQYDREGGSRLDVRFVDVAPYTPEAEEARLLGVQSMQVPTDEDGRRGVQEVFMGVVVSSPNDEVVVPIFEAGTSIEYELTRSIRTVANEKRLTVGIVTTDARVAGGFDMTHFRQLPEWRIHSELKKQYKVEQVAADSPIDEKKYDVLVAVMPSSLSPAQLPNLVDYVKKGRPTLIFDDPLPVFDGGGAMAPRMPKPRPGGMMGQFNQQPPEPKAEDIAWDNGEVIFDVAGGNVHPEFANVIQPELVFVTTKSGNKGAISPNSKVTADLQELLTFFPGEIRQRKESELKFEALLRSSVKSGVHEWENITRQSGNPFGGGGIEINPNPPRQLTGEAYTLAAHITGKDVKDRKGVNVIFVADADLISNQLFSLEASQQLPNLRIDNIKFVLNCVDVLAGESAYIDLRKRRAQLRTLTALQAVSDDFRKAQTDERGKAESEAKEQLSKAQKRLDEKIEEIEKNTALTPQQKAQQIGIARETEQRKLDVMRANIEREKAQKIERIEAKTKQQIRAYEDWIRWWCILLPPIPAVVLGVIVLSSRINAEYRNVEADRLVK
ncbi:MAG: ABC transporter, partial [Planctomycetota bacterium]